MECLCPVLAHAYMRLYANMTVQLTLAFSSVTLCDSVMAEDDLLPYLLEDPAEMEGSLCAADGGYMTNWVETRARMEQAGRVRYSPEHAGALVEFGRQYYRMVPGATQPDAGNLDMDAYMQGVMNLVVGLRPLGQSCALPVECVGFYGDAGVDCVWENGLACGGTCQSLTAEGGECGLGRPACAFGTTCMRPGGAEVGRCEVAEVRGQGEPCAVDGGTYSCAVDLTCREGVCQGPSGPDGGCGGDDDCTSGLVCSNSRCQTPLPLGAPCDVWGVKCDTCLVCTQVPGEDTGNHCIAWANETESCTRNPCVFGTQCMGGQCKALVRRGQPCGFADRHEPGGDMRGNCLHAADTCTGDPLTCQPRGTLGQPCETVADFHSQVGTCSQKHFCKRDAATQSQGTCEVLPGEGQPCGDAPGLAAECAADGPELRCTNRSDGGVGTCIASPSPEGSPCVSSDDCAGDLGCETSTGDGRCVVPPGVGSLCTGMYRCRNARCVYGGQDAGYGSICVPYRALGESCSMQDECGPEGMCASGECRGKPHLGEPCESSTGCVDGGACVAGYCREQACADKVNTESCVAYYTWYFLLFGVVVGSRAMKRPRRS